MKKLTMGLFAAALGLGGVMMLGSSMRMDTRIDAESTPAAPQRDFVDATSHPSVGTERSAPVQAQQIRCANACPNVLEALWANASLSDDDFVALFADVNDVARYLSGDVGVRAGLIDLALNSDDGNKRALIRGAFEQASSAHRRELGTALLAATDPLRRREGVNLLAAEVAFDPATSARFTALLATELDVYTKIAAIRGLDKPDYFRGDRAVLDALQSTLRTEISPQLLGEALVVSARLVSEPEEIFHAVSGAIVSANEDYRFYGLRALETILQSTDESQQALGWQSRAQAKATLEELLDQDAVRVPAGIVREASFIYARHFH